MTDISIVICTYNRARSLERTIRSIFDAQSFVRDLNVEIVVVDNNSIDDTREQVLSIAASRENVRYVHEDKQGVASARNRGIKESNANIVVFTDDDCIVSERWLDAIHKGFAQDDTDVIGGRILPIWEGKRPRWLIDEMRGRLAILDYGEVSFTVNPEQHPFYTANLAFRRNCVILADGFPEGLKRGEDLALLDILSAHGSKIVYQPDMTVSHIIPAARLTKRYFRRWHWENGIELSRLERKNIDEKHATIPKYMLRSLAQEIALTIYYYLTFSRYAFYHECRVLFYAGFIHAMIFRRRL